MMKRQRMSGTDREEEIGWVSCLAVFYFIWWNLWMQNKLFRLVSCLNNGRTFENVSVLYPSMVDTLERLSNLTNLYLRFCLGEMGPFHCLILISSPAVVVQLPPNSWIGSWNMLCCTMSKSWELDKLSISDTSTFILSVFDFSWALQFWPSFGTSKLSAVTNIENLVASECRFYCKWQWLCWSLCNLQYLSSYHQQTGQCITQNWAFYSKSQFSHNQGLLEFQLPRANFSPHVIFHFLKKEISTPLVVIYKQMIS